MPEQKTKPTSADASQFVNSITDSNKRNDALVLLNLFKKVTKMPPVLWSSNMIGFGEHHYKYASGHEGDTFNWQLAIGNKQ